MLTTMNAFATNRFNSLNRTTVSPRFGQGTQDINWAVDELLNAVGVPLDLMGEPRIKTEKIAKMILIVAQLSDEAKAKLKEKAAKKELSAWAREGATKIVPANYEEELLKLLK